MDEVVSTVLNQVLPHWPFAMMTVIFAVIGQFTSKSLFTKERAYQKQKASRFYRFWESQSFWWWGRETLPLHPIMSGALLGLLWHNPEGTDPAWGLAAGIGYFAGSGATSLFVWSILRGYLKKRGIDLDLPGGISSLTPPPMPEEEKHSVEKTSVVAEEESSNA